jgi:RHS repeat-associated protein
VNNPGTSSPATSSYVYDAAGSLLMQKDAAAGSQDATTTLYLPDEQLTLDTKTGTITGDRFLALPGGGEVVRTGVDTTSGTPGYYYQLSDQHGTATLAVGPALTAAQATWRQFSPYGAPRGPAVTWMDNRGFLDKPQDAATGLTSVGARWYDPASGMFQSLDPVFEAGSPQQQNGYTYAGGNPVTGSDPSGEVCQGGYTCINGQPGVPVSQNGSNDPQPVQVSTDFGFNPNVVNVSALKKAYAHYGNGAFGLRYVAPTVPDALASYVGELDTWTLVCTLTNLCPSGFKKFVTNLDRQTNTGIVNTQGGWKCAWLGECNYSNVAASITWYYRAMNKDGEMPLVRGIDNPNAKSLSFRARDYKPGPDGIVRPGGKASPKGLSMNEEDPEAAWKQGLNMNASDLWKISSDKVPGIFEVLAAPTKDNPTHVVWDTQVDLSQGVIDLAIRESAASWIRVYPPPELP